MIKFIGVKRRRNCIEVVCEDCHTLWVAAYFPLSLERLQDIQDNTICIQCHSINVSVFEDSIND